MTKIHGQWIILKPLASIVALSVISSQSMEILLKGMLWKAIINPNYYSPYQVTKNLETIPIMNVCSRNGLDSAKLNSTTSKISIFLPAGSTKVNRVVPFHPSICCFYVLAK